MSLRALTLSGGVLFAEDEASEATFSSQEYARLQEIALGRTAPSSQ